MTICEVPEVATVDVELQIPESYRNLAEVFRDDKAWVMPHHQEDYLGIELEPRTSLGFRRTYKLSEKKKDALDKYLNSTLASSLIWPSKPLAETPILFASKDNGGLKMYVDYRDLNTKTLKNCYPLPLIEDHIGQLVGA